MYKGNPAKLLDCRCTERPAGMLTDEDMSVKHLSTKELDAGLGEIQRSPKDEGILVMIARRPQIEEREVLQEAQLNLEEGVVGDRWKDRSNGRAPDKSPHPEMQLNIMNARVIALVAQSTERWPLTGDEPTWIWT